MTACNLLRRRPWHEAITATCLPTGICRSWILAGLLSIPYSFAHLNSQAFDRMISPADVLPPPND